MANPKAAQKLKVKKQELETKAVAHDRYVKVAPTKVRDLLDLIRGKNISEAETTLKFSGRKGGRAALKVLKSAEANAGSPQDKENWFVTEARADKGPIFRRSYEPKPRGARGIIATYSTHLTIGVGMPKKEEIKDAKKS